MDFGNRDSLYMRYELFYDLSKRYITELCNGAHADDIKKGYLCAAVTIIYQAMHCILRALLDVLNVSYYDTETVKDLLGDLDNAHISYLNQTKLTDTFLDTLEYWQYGVRNGISSETTMEMIVTVHDTIKYMSELYISLSGDSTPKNNIGQLLSSAEGNR